MKWCNLRVSSRQHWLALFLFAGVALFSIACLSNTPVQALNTYETGSGEGINSAFNKYKGDDRPWLSGATCELSKQETGAAGQPIIGTGGSYKCKNGSLEWTCNVIDEAIQKDTFQCDDDKYGNDKPDGTIMTDGKGIEWLCDSYAASTGTCIAQDGSGRTCTLGVDCEWNRAGYDAEVDTCTKGHPLGWLVCPMADLVAGTIDTLINQFLLPMLQWRIVIK